MSQVQGTTVLPQPEWQQRYLIMLPKIERLAHRAFRRCSVDLREELVSEVIADTYRWYRRLVERGRECDAHASVLAAYAVKRVGSGVRVGSSQNRYDVMSRSCEVRFGVRCQSLQTADGCSVDWREMLLECRRASPFELAASRIDLDHWLSTLSLRDRAIALALAAGEETFRVAQQFGLSRGRISQKRRELAESWSMLHGLDANGREIEAIAA